jgi:hypothetical protein
MGKVGELETYGEESKVEEKKKSILGRLWDNTIGKKLEEKRTEDELRKQAREEAKPQIIEAMKKRIVEEEIAKASKPKKNPLQTLADELKVIPATDEKMDRLIGKRDGYSTADRISRNLGLEGEGRKFNTDLIGKIPDIDSGKVMSNQKFPRAKTETLNIKRNKYDENIRRALGK